MAISLHNKGLNLKIKSKECPTNIQTELQDVYTALSLQKLHEGI
jgi:hypothetical protein